MSLLLRRRAMMGMEKKEPTGILSYWLSGEDEPVNGKWVDRITGDTWTLYNGASQDAVNGLYLFDTPQKCAMLDGSDQNFSNKMYLGHHWRIVFNLYAKRSTSNGVMCFFDIGSVGEGTKALGFAIGNSNGRIESKVNILNWKLQGNDSTPFPPTMSHPSIPLMPADEFVHAVGTYEIYDGGDGYDRLRATINGVTINYDTPIPQVTYNNWVSVRNRIMVGRSSYAVPSDTTNTHSACFKIKDIKIYIID